VRLGTYSARYGILPPAAVVATRAQATDPRAAPRYGERIPYVVVYGEPGAGAQLTRALAVPPMGGRA
jgi:DNA polymerase zeta